MMMTMMKILTRVQEPELEEPSFVVGVPGAVKACLYIEISSAAGARSSMQSQLRWVMYLYKT